MSKEKLNNLIDKVVGKVGPLRVPAYWMNKTLKEIGGWISKTEESVAAVDSKVDKTKASIPTKVSQLENDAELASKYNLPHWRDVSFDPEGEFIPLVPFSLSAYKGYFESGYLKPDDTMDGNRYEFLCVLDENSVLGYYSGDYPPLASNNLTLGVYKITLEFIGAECVFHNLEKLDTVGGVSLLTYRNSEDKRHIFLDRNSSAGLYYKGRPLPGTAHIPDGIGEHIYVNFGGKRDFSTVDQLIRVKSSNRVIEYEFKGVKSLLDVDFSELEEMAANAFNDCSALKTVNLGTKLKEIGGSAFSGCSSLTSITIPNSVTSIGTYAFHACSSLTSVTIPNSITEIRKGAFSFCWAVKRVDISDLSAWCKISFNDTAANPTHYGAKLCLNGSELADITIPSDITEIKSFTFYKCNSLTRIIILDNITSIGGSAFYGCSSLESVSIPDSVDKITGGIFEECISLKSITIPNSVTEIGHNAFYKCKKLTSVTVPDSVTTIGYHAFSSCGLTSVTIPDSVTTIGDCAFSFCTSLTSVYCKATTPPSLGGTYVFDDNGSGRKIYVPAESVDAYKSATNWSEYADAIVGYDFENNTPVE